ncbi:MAG: hypothetical protein ACTHLJ_00550 [Angustibacter sp.]
MTGARLRGLAGYGVHSSIAWPLVPAAVAWLVFADFATRGRAWAGDWVMAMTWIGGPLIFVAVAVAGVAAYDAGRWQTGAGASAVDSFPGRAREVLRLWASATVPFVLAHLLCLVLVMAALILDGAPYGQVVAPVAQQLAVIGFAAALGVLVGAVLGPRLGAFAAIVLAAYLVYWRGYVARYDEPPTRIISATSTLVGYKLSEPLVAVQVLAATLWVVGMLMLVVFSRPDAQSQRRPAPVAAVAVVALLVGAGGVTPRLTAGWVDPVPTAVPRRCTGSDVRVCLYAGHDGQLRRVEAIASRIHAAAQRQGLGDLFPTRVVEQRVTGGAAGQLWFVPDDLGHDVSESTVVDAMLPGQACPQLSADVLTDEAGAFVGAVWAAEQTVTAMAAGRPVADWHMQPQQLRRFVQGARTCDLRAAVGQR